MKALRRFAKRLAGTFRGRRHDERMREELQSHFALLTEEYLDAGMALDDARRRARLQLGAGDAIAEACRDEARLRPLEDMWQDVRYALRTLRNVPTFSATVMLTLALGIGVTTAIVAAVTPVLFEPLPYPDSARLVSLVETAPSSDQRFPTTFGMFAHLSERARSLESMAVMRAWQPVLTGVDIPERLDGQRVSADYFRVLGVSPALGRDFRAEDDRPAAPPVVILSHGLWQRRFGGDPAILDRRIQLDETPYTVVGIMPAGFENVLAPSAVSWTPLQYDLSQGRAWGHHLQAIGRLRGGVSLEAASRDVHEAGQAVLAALRPETYDRATRFSLASLKDDLVRGVAPVSSAVLGAVALLLAIACVNVANLMLARGIGRRGELALRGALGAGRWRIVRQLVTESMLIAALGGTAGMVAARLILDVLGATAPAGVFSPGSARLAGPVLWFGVGLMTLVGLALGLIAVWHGGRQELGGALGRASRRNTGARRSVRRALVVVEVALAIVLLVGSGLLLRSLSRLLAIDPGFDPTGVLTVTVQVSKSRYATAEDESRFVERTLDAIRAIPGVRAAGATSQLPLSGDLDEYGAHFEADAQQPARSHNVFRYGVSSEYLTALGIPLREGRFLAATDRAGGPHVALISESLARRRFPGVSPVGARLRLGPEDGTPYTIVGVVGAVHQMTLAADEADAVYTPAVQWPFADPVQSLVIRTAGDPRAIVAQVRDAIRSVDSDQPIVRVATMRELVLGTAAERRFVLSLFQVFAFSALALAVAGIYGLLAGTVVERTREIGVRSALGATRRGILSLIVGEGMRLTVIGAAVGFALAAWATRFIGALLFGVSRFDPWTHVVAVTVLAGAAVLACVGPAWRAVRIDPVTTLRAE